MREKKDFNFVLRWEQVQAHHNGGYQSRQNRLRRSGVIGGVLVLAIVGSFPWLWTFKLQYELSTTNQKIGALQDVDQHVKKVDNLKAQIQSEHQLLNLVQQNTLDPGPLFEKLKVLLPVGTTINAFSLQADKTVKITLSAPIPVDVARFWVSFQNSGLFERVDIQTVSLKDKIQDIALNLKLK